MTKNQYKQINYKTLEKTQIKSNKIILKPLNKKMTKRLNKSLIITFHLIQLMKKNNNKYFKILKKKLYNDNEVNHRLLKATMKMTHYLIKSLITLI